METHYKQKLKFGTEGDNEYLQDFDNNKFDEEAKLNLEVLIDDLNYALHKEMF